MAERLRVAVVGHVEYVEFARVDHVPVPGEIVHADSTFTLPAGGGAVAAVQLLKLAGSCTLYTALGDDEVGHRAERELRELGLDVDTAYRPGEAQRRGFTFLDAKGERTITVIGSRLGPLRSDALDWDAFGQTDAVYFTAGDEDALRAARAAKALVATSRVLTLLSKAGVELDAVIGSARDQDEQYEEGVVDPAPRFVVMTAGNRGGTWTGAEGRSGSWAAAEVPGPVADAYGCGDSFAAGLTYGLGAGLDIEEALELGARCGAMCLTGHGPYERQLTQADLDPRA